MEKLIYLLWKPGDEPRGQFARRLTGETAGQLLALEPAGLQLNVVDESVRPAEHMLIENSRPRYYAMVSLWLHTALERQPYEQILQASATRIAGYLVTESCPLPNTTAIAGAGERTGGFSHVVLLRRPPRLSFSDWIAIWHGSHTQVAIDTQSTFFYRQNVVARALTYAAPPYDAIIEEGFPTAAMTSWEAFYDAEGDAGRFRRHQQAMLDSCVRFIDFDKIDACSTSEYVYRRLYSG